jgi:hypothetical protein
VADPERDWVTLRREHVGMLLAAALAVLGHLVADHPNADATFKLATAVSAAERVLLGDSPDAETPAPENEDGRAG